MQFNILRGTVAALWAAYAATIVSAQVSAPTGETMMQLERIEVQGSRLPTASLIRLSGLQIGTTVNDSVVKSACHKITVTGLFKKIEYAYDAYPDRPGVVLTLTVADEQTLVPASIQPQQDEGNLWQALAALDPLFTRELPPTEKAVRFYADNLEHCLKVKGRANEYVEAAISGDSKGNPTAIVFQIRKYKGAAVPSGR